MTSTGTTWDEWIHVVRRQLNTTDPRVGSSRDGSNSTSPLKVTAGTNSASFSTLFMTFVPVAIYAAVCVVIFIVGRKFLPRVYAPRTFLGSLGNHERTKELPKGWFNWMKQFWNTPDIEVLHRSTFDGFLFLRYLKVLCVICVFGMCLTWPILLPLHAMGGGGNAQLDMLTFGNILHPSWCYGHALLAWVFFGFILFMVGRECVFFINVRQAYLLSPFYANRLSSRTVLFTCVPTQILDEKKLRRVFGDTVKNVWIPRVIEDLDVLVNEREQTAFRLERAEIELIKKANVAYQKALKSGHPDIMTGVVTPTESSAKESKGPNVEVKADSPSSPLSPLSSIISPVPRREYVGGDSTQTERSSKESKGMNVEIQADSLNSSLSPLSSTISPASPREYTRSDGTPITMTNYGFSGPSQGVVGSVAALWIPAEERPYHRPIANYGRRVDTIRWTRSRLKALGIKISKLRRDYRKGKGRPIPACFIEFHSQVDAQAAYQTLAHHSANHMRPEIVGVRPEEIQWGAMYFSWYERIIRRFLIQGFVAAMVIFWSIPAAFIGIISNIKYLTGKLVFLKWINDLPSVILGLISGLLPAIALSLLMSAVPIVLRMCARQAGVPTASKIELFVQNSYFIFQLVQVFLITTLTSAASAALTQILQDPLSLRSLLSQNLPKASNFYISYFILQGLAMSATRIVHMISIFRHSLLANSGMNPRIISKRYHRLRKIHWGSVYPVFTNMGIIAISYSLIAPIVLIVAAIGLSIVYITYRYNLLYVYSSHLDTRGLCYPRALKQTLAGVYIAEICLIGLFGIKGAYGPVVLMFGLVIFSALFHISLNDALSPLLYNLPRTLAAEEELLKAGNPPFLAENLADKNDNDFELSNPDGGDVGYDSDFDPSSNVAEVSHGVQSSRGATIPIEGGDAAFSLTTKTLKSMIKKKYSSSPIPGYVAKMDFWSRWITPTPNPDKPPNFLMKFLHPEVFCNYHVLRSGIPPELYNLPESDLDSGNAEDKDAFSHPSMRKRSPRLWIPRDDAGVSVQEVMHSGQVVEITDQGAWVDAKGGVGVDLDGEAGAWVARGFKGEGWGLEGWW